jgi:rhodanese-related sulfurtransferase
MLAGLVRLFRKAPAEPRWIEVAVLRDALAGPRAPLVVDVRGADEFGGPLGHIEGACNIPLPELVGRYGELARAGGRPIVCVCLTDRRSSAAAAQLAAAGVDGVSVLRGGMKAWREAGL